MLDKPTQLAQRLARHPALQERLESILNIMESNGDDLKRADEAEQQIIETLHQLGHDALSGWADRHEERQPKRANRQRVGFLWVKTLYWHSTYGLIEVNERLFRQGTYLQRPFSARAGVRCRGVSVPLQRVVTDFAADHPFRQVSEKLQEHYGVTLPSETIRQTMEHDIMVVSVQRFKASNSTPPPIMAMPAHSRIDGRSPRKITAKIATNTRLSLSTGATFEASPIFNARK